MKSKNTVKYIVAAELVLLVPFVAMFFTDEVKWGLADFIIVGVLLAGIGIAAQLIINGVKTNSRQVAIGVVLAALMLLMWVELAVGLFGSPFAGS
jgi:hypothetical protein